MPAAEEQRVPQQQSSLATGRVSTAADGGVRMSARVPDLADCE